MVNLILAFIWLGIAVTAFVMPRIRPDGNPWTILDTGISIGWVAVAFFVYNVIRWWASGAKPEPRPLFPHRTSTPGHGERPPNPQSGDEAIPPA